MTENTIRQIVQRAVRDGAFRAQLKRDPAAALAGYSLSESERAAISSGDPKRLSALGVDQRMSKAFTDFSLGSVSKSIDPDMTGASPNSKTFVDDATFAGGKGSAIVGDPAAPRSSLVEPGQSPSSLHMRLVEQDLNIAGSAGVGISVAPVPTGGGMSADGTSFDPGLISGSGAASADAADGSLSDGNLRRIEGDLDVTRGTNLDLPQPTTDGNPTEY